MTEKFETAHEFMENFMRNKYSKMETIVAKVLEEHPETDPMDLEIHYDADTKEAIAIYKKVKVYDFKELEKDKLDDITLRERYRDNLLMDPSQCIHLKEVDKVIRGDGKKCPLYKCEKGHSICQKSMFDPICEDYELEYNNGELKE